MNIVKKVALGAAAVAFTAALSVGVNGASADASSIDPSNVSVDFESQTLTYSGSGNTKFYVGVPSVSVKTSGSSSTVTVKSKTATEYDCERDGGNIVDGSIVYKYGTTVDLSSLAVTKDIYLQVYGNNDTDPILIKIPAAISKLKGTVSLATTDADGNVTVNENGAVNVVINNTTDTKNPVAVTNVEYSTASGNWTDYSAEDDFSSYAKLGTTLRFRVKASEAETLGESEALGDYTVYPLAGSFASNEVKVKISKAANGPKATIDYSAHTIKVASTVEYRINSSAELGEFTTAEAAIAADKTVGELSGKTYVLKADVLGLTDGTYAELDVRTPASAKKVTSNITEYSLAAKADLAAKAADDGEAVEDGDTVLNVGVYSSTDDGATPDVTCTAVDISKAKYKVVISNSSAYAYEVALADKADASAIGKATKISAAGKNGASSKTLTATEGQYIFIRRSGDSKAMLWSTDYVLMGQAKAIVETSPDSSTDEGDASADGETTGE
ncbi:MAG: hypothetical protein LUH14_07250 [Clostridiaceae bacterium]|nr:hypothetical protein [Clostridiaceae bacterium]